MGTKKKSLNFYEFSPSVIDEKTETLISPVRLPDDGSKGLSWVRTFEIEAALETITKDPTPEDFYKAASVLVFHARHLKPYEHAELAQLIRYPYQRSAGKPENVALKIAAFDAVYLNALTKLKYKSRVDMICNLAKAFEVTKAIARRAVLEAEGYLVDSKKRGAL